MNSLRKGALFAALALQAGPAAAAASGGAEPFDFLFLDSSARAVALGGACTASSGADALHYNPAGLYGLGESQATVMHNQYFEGISQQYAAYASPRGWGASLNYLDFGDTPRTTISNHTGAGLGGVELTDLALTAGYAEEVRPGAAVGAAVKYLRESADGVSGGAFAVDLGAAWTPASAPRLRTGLAVQNVGQDVKFNTVSEKLPVNVRLGASYRAEVRKLPALFSLDLSKQASDALIISAGGELTVARDFRFRLGYSGRNAAGPGITAGLGYVSGDAAFDYAFAPLGDLGAAHRLSATFRWGGKAGGPEKAAPAGTAPEPAGSAAP